MNGLLSDDRDRCRPEVLRPGDLLLVREPIPARFYGPGYAPGTRLVVARHFGGEIMLRNLRSHMMPAPLAELGTYTATFLSRCNLLPEGSEGTLLLSLIAREARLGRIAVFQGEEGYRPLYHHLSTPDRFPLTKQPIDEYLIAQAFVNEVGARVAWAVLARQISPLY